MRSASDDFGYGVGGFERGDDAFDFGELKKGFERFFVGGISVLSAGLVTQPSVLWPYSGIVEASGDAVG